MEKPNLASAQHLGVQEEGGCAEQQVHGTPLPCWHPAPTLPPAAAHGP